MAQAKANRGILYVDEVNLLDDGLVDVVLDSAASGVNTVEREGISIAHPARFIMIGSGNPSEVPQLCPSFCLPVMHPELVYCEQLHKRPLQCHPVRAVTKWQLPCVCTVAIMLPPS